MEEDSSLNRCTNSDELQKWFVEFYARLRSAVRMRFPPKLLTRADASDVVQLTFVEAAERYSEYCRDRSLPPYLWLRTLALQRLAILIREHFGTQKRSVSREAGPKLEVSSVALAECLVDSKTTPGHSAIKREEFEKLHAALETLSPDDRDILVLRHFEQLDYREAGVVLGITPETARQRHHRALERLGEIVSPILGDCLQD